jgi:hypothetical protein
MKVFLLTLLSFVLAYNVYAQLPKQPLTQPNHAQETPNHDKRGTEQSPIVIKVLPPFNEDEKTAAEKKERQDKTESDWWLVKLTGTLAAIGVLQLVVFGLQARRLRQTVDEMKIATKASEKSAEAARKSAEVAEKALITTTKAIVFNSKIHQVAGLSQKAGMAVTDWTFFIIWENTGTTPTRHLHMSTNWKPFDTGMPDDFDFPDLSAPPFIRPKIVIGPKATTWSGGCEIPIAVLIEASEKKKHIYLWGWVEYNDVFDATTRHRTECCIEIVVAGDPRVAHAPGDFSSPNIPFLCHGGAQFNGMDEECYRQPKKYPTG